MWGSMAVLCGGTGSQNRGMRQRSAGESAGMQERGRLHLSAAASTPVTRAPPPPSPSPPTAAKKSPHTPASRSWSSRWVHCIALSGDATGVA